MNDPNFNSIEGKYVKLHHHSFAKSIEMTVIRSTTDENVQLKQVIWMDYSQFESLVDVIKSIENDTP